MEKTVSANMIRQTLPDVQIEGGSLMKRTQSNLEVSVNNLKVNISVTSEFPVELAEEASRDLSGRLSEILTGCVNSLEETLEMFAPMERVRKPKSFNAEEALNQLPPDQYEAVKALILKRQGLAA